MAILDIVVQSAALSVFSNILAQVIDAYQKNAPLSSINIVPILQFVTYAVLNTPINCIWQDWLEAQFPSNKVVAKPKANGKAAAKEEEKVLDVKNTVIKFIMDQTVGAGFNIPLFIGIIGMVKGQSLDQIVTTIQKDALDIYFSGMKLWPPVSIISFAFIPPQHRVIFGSLAGVIWNIYLSLMAR